MTQRTRKLLGVVATLVGLIVYCTLATAIYLALPGDLPVWLVLLYFAVAGLAWTFPAIAIIRWMAKPDRP